MYPASSSSAAYPSRRGVSSSSSVVSSSRHHQDERLSSGPLTTERAMMEQIRSKLERTQRRMARDHATTTSQHGYNSSHGAPMSMRDMPIASSSTSISSSRHHHHHHHHHEQAYRSTTSRHPPSRSAAPRHHPSSSSTSATQHAVGSSHYFPPDYRSKRAPAVQSVYLEDLSMTINSSQRAPPSSSRAPTSYAPGTSSGVGAIHTSSYYAPPLDETQRSSSRPTTATRTRHVHTHSSYESVPVASRAPVRSERHDVHQLDHHHHPHRTQQSQQSSSRPDERTREKRSTVAAPPPSTRGILRKSSSLSTAPPSATMPHYYGGEYAPPSASNDYLVYSSSHGSVPVSHRRQPLSSSGQPARSALKQHRSDSIESRPRGDSGSATTTTTDAPNDSNREAAAAAVVQPPPSSRVRFDDELRLAIQYPPLMEEDEDAFSRSDSDPEPLEFLGAELPYDPRDDFDHEVNDEQENDVAFAYNDNENATPTELPLQLEPVVEITRAPLVATDTDVRESSPRSPEATVVNSSMPTSSTTRNDTTVDSAPSMPPVRRRGSSAVPTPPTLSPSGSSYARKSLTEPPKSAIDASLFDQYDLRERRASKERRFSNANGSGGRDDDVDIDALAVSVVNAASTISTDRNDDGVDAFASSSMDPPPQHALSTMNDVYEHDSDSDYGEYSDGSQGSLHESHLAFDDDDVASMLMPLPPPRTFSPVRHSTHSEKLSPSSTEDYCDAQTFPDEDEDPQHAARHDPSTAAASDLVVHQTPQSEYKNFWEETSSEESGKDDTEPEIESAIVSKDVTAPRRAPPPPPSMKKEVKLMKQSRGPPRSGWQPRNVDAFAHSAIEVVNVNDSPSSPKSVRPSHQPSYRPNHAHSVKPRSPRKPMPLSQSLMMFAPPPATTDARVGHRPPPASTRIRPSPATSRLSSSVVSVGGVPRAPVTADGSQAGSTYVPRRLRPKSTAAPHSRKALPPSIGALSGLASGPVTFELNVASFYEVEWTTGEFGFSFQRVYLEDVDEHGAPTTRRLFLRMLLNTERGTCASFKHVHVGDVLVEIDGTRVCDIKLDTHGGGGAALTKLFTELRKQTPLRLVFQRMDAASWDGGVEL